MHSSVLKISPATLTFKNHFRSSYKTWKCYTRILSIFWIRYVSKLSIPSANPIAVPLRGTKFSQFYERSKVVWRGIIILTDGWSAPQALLLAERPLSEYRCRYCSGGCCLFVPLWFSLEGVTWPKERWWWDQHCKFVCMRADTLGPGLSRSLLGAAAAEARGADTITLIHISQLQSASSPSPHLPSCSDPSGLFF